MPLLEIVAASAHYLAILALTGVLVAELILLGFQPEASVVRRLAKVDIVYGILAGFVILTGIGRILTSPEGHTFFEQSPVFWAKMGVFAVVGILSVFPSLKYARWAKALKTAETLPETAAFKGARRLVLVQLHLLMIIPVLAVLLAASTEA